MKNRFAHSLEALESRIAPAAVLTVSRSILTIHSDADGESLSILQGADGTIDVLDASNHSVMPTGHAQVVRGIIFIGGPGADAPDTKLQAGLRDPYGNIAARSLPAGFVINDP